jgi:HlyD family type I secretion membrane fusion protein
MSSETSSVPAGYAPLPSMDWRAPIRFGYFIVFGGFGLFMVWASLTRLDGAAIAPGVISSESNRKTVQHLEGGIVQEILVRDGMRVETNQLLVKLDPTRLDTQGDLYSNQLAILQAQEARLLSEFEGREQLEFPDAVRKRENDPAVAPVVADQTRLFASRRDTLTRNTSIADSQIEQTRKEIEQAKSDINTARATLEQVSAELAELQPLFKRQLVPMTRIAPLERERLRLTGIVNTGEIQIAKLGERLSEVTLKRQQVVQDYRQEASTLLLDVRNKLNDVKQQLLLTSDLQRRAEIRAPINGVIQQMRVFTMGGVIRPGDPILDIAPDNDELVIRARVDPNDADRVTTGMRSEIRFPAFNYWGEKVIRGTVRSLSRDRVVENNGKDVYFAAEIIVDKTTMPKEIEKNLSAGISADVIIITGERSVANYLLRPFVERFYHSMRER